MLDLIRKIHYRIWKAILKWETYLLVNSVLFIQENKTLSSFEKIKNFYDGKKFSGKKMEIDGKF